MICPKCGNEVNNDIEFCPYCGANLIHEEKEEHKYCNICGFELNESDNFCPVCGSPVEKAKDVTTIEVENNELDKSINDTSKQDDQDLLAFIGQKKYSYYKEKFDEINKNPASWNWCAFLFGPFWFVYRKYFLPGIIYVLCIMSFAIMNHYLDIPQLGYATSLIGVIAWISFGLFGNYLYKQRYEKIHEQSLKLTGKERTEFLKKSGGTNVGYVFLLIGMYYTLAILLVFLD